MLDDTTSPGWVSPLREGLSTSPPEEPRLEAWPARRRVNPALVEPDRALLQSLPGPLMRLHRALPLQLQQNVLLLGMEDPNDLALPDTVRRLTGWEVQVIQLCPQGGPLPQGKPEPEEVDPTPSPAFQLCRSRLEVRLTGSLVWVSLSQTYLNSGSQPLGGQYRVPFPPNAQLQNLRAELSGRMLPLSHVQRLQLGGQGYVTGSLDPLPPGEPFQLNIQYVHLLERADEGFRLFLPCPLGDKPLESSLTLQWPGLSPQYLSCSRPATWVRTQQDQLEIQIQPGESQHHQPLVLSYRPPHLEKSLHGQLLSDGQHFLLFLQAPPRPQTAPRHVIFLLDRSASLEGWPALQGREAVVQGLSQLRPLDHFALALFDEEVVSWQDGRWIGAGAVSSARQWLQQQAGGAGTTDLVRALEWVRQHYRDQTELYLVVLSDGQGGHPGEALRLAASLRKELRLFTLGLGSHCQTHFLKRLAELGGGSSVLANSSPELKPAINRLMQQLGQPLLTNVQLVGQGFHSDPAQQHPERLSEIFWGQQLTVLGRHQGTGPLIARGLSPQGPMSLTLTPRITNHPGLGSLWAQAQREGLQNRLGQARVAERNRIAEQIQHLERTYSLEPAADTQHFHPELWRPRESFKFPTSISDLTVVQQLLDQAVSRQASHIHIEQQSDRLKVRLRVCGKLQVFSAPFGDGQAPQLLTQIRQLCNLQNGEGLFQNGRFHRDCQGLSYLFEASFCPTVNGEKVVLELRPAHLRSHQNLAEPARSAISALLTRRRGLLLVCGAKGCGGNSLIVDWLGQQFPDRHAVLCHKEEWFGLQAASQVIPTPDLASILQELEGHDIDVLACTGARQRAAWESLLRRAGERSLVLARHHAPRAGLALAELLEQGIDGRSLGKALLGAISLRQLPRLCSCKVAELDPNVLSALSGQGDYARRGGCPLCHGEGLRGSVLCSEVLLYRTEIFAVLKPGVNPDRLEQAFIRYPMAQQLLRLAQQGVIEARHCLSPGSTF
ncbi:VWA domain-containing protein [bacterium]|nr:VWA domain-containing protein [bacterium]